MLHFNLENPIGLKWFGEFISPEREWKHLTRTLLEYEMMIVTEGVLYIADEKEEYEVREGEYLIMSPTRFQHGTRVCKCRFYWMHFECPALPASVSMPAQSTWRNKAQLERLAGCLLESESTAPRSLLSCYLATALLLELAAQPNDEGSENKSPHEAVCARVKEFIVWHKFSDVRVKDIARALGYHEKYLSTVFSKTEGITLKEYLLAQRIAEAKRLLLETEYTVSEVAYYLNFESPHNFSRFFKTKTETTPLAFRRENKTKEK